MEYLDFELEVSPGSGRKYPVAVIRSPAGEARETMHFPFGDLELENHLLRLRNALLRSGGKRRTVLTKDQRTVQDFGRALFDALLTNEVRVRYSMSQEKARLQGKGLRLKLRFNTPEMAALPWEFLYDPRRAEYVCLSQDTPIVRYLELPQPIQPLAATPPLRILGMVASPSNLGGLNVDLEKQRVETALHGLQDEGFVELTWLQGQTWRALQRAIRRGDWHIFHFIGHGDFDVTADEGLVMLCDEDGRAQRMHATRLGRLLANHRALRLVLLNACEGATGSTRDLFSSTASILVRRGLPAVLAMQYPITDRAAVEFSRTFYESLVDGLPVDAAVVESRVAISLAVNNTVEWGTPVLFMRSPDGTIFKVQEIEGTKHEERSEKSATRIQHSESSNQDQEPEDQTGLPGDVLRRLQATLLRCGVFDSDRGLRAVFLDARLNPWRDQLPQATSPSERVQVVADYLYSRANASGDNALVLLLQALRDLTDTGDALYAQLGDLATEMIVWMSGFRQGGIAASAPSRQPFEPELILIPAGEFVMGSDPKKDKLAFDYEQPQHTLYLPDYYIAKTPVTNVQWKAFIEATNREVPEHWKNGAIPRSKDNHPVIYISWDDAMAYCRWLADVTGKPYTLPSEAQWEKAARGTDGHIYPWGDRFDKSKCNNRKSGIGGTTPVDTYPQGASPYGVLDMVGNVWEWTRTCWVDSYRNYNDNILNDVSKNCATRVARGGSFYDLQYYVRCAYRLSLRAYLRLGSYARNSNRGVRMVVVGGGPY